MNTVSIRDLHIFEDGVAWIASVDFTPLDARASRNGNAFAGDERVGVV